MTSTSPTHSHVSRRTAMKLLAATAAGGALGVGRIRPAAAGDHGSWAWRTVTPGTPITGLGFRIVTGNDDLRGPGDLTPASAVVATVLLRSAAGERSVVRQLNGSDEGWPNHASRDKWFSFAGSGLPTITAENIVSFRLDFTPNNTGVWGDNWNMYAISIWHRKSDGLPDPPFTGSMNTADFNAQFTGSGQEWAWMHRFKENFDDEGSPRFVSSNPFWNSAAGQRNWRWCNRCQGLFFGGNPTTGACPLGGGHNRGSGNYVMFAYAPIPAHSQAGWRWCNRCQGLFAPGNNSNDPNNNGVCPLGGGHNPGGSGAYTMFWGDGVAGSKQGLWRWCHRCKGLMFSGNPKPWPCPAGGDHDPNASAPYAMTFSSRNP
jgi:hypothetical protein